MCAAVGFGIGASGLGITADASAPSRATPAPTSATEPAHPRPPSASGGDIAAAERWFSKPQTEVDLIELHDSSIDPHSTRLVESKPGAWRVWVALDQEGRLCLLAAGAPDPATVIANAGTGAPRISSSCVDPAAFVDAGATLSVPGLLAIWDGSSVTTSMWPVS